jgi:hypothetical protein
MIDLTLADMAAITTASGADLDDWAKILQRPARHWGETDDAFRMRILGVRMQRFDRPVQVVDGWYAPPGVYPVRGGD